MGLIPDALSFLRVLSTWPVMYYGLHERWGLAFLFLALGWGTDLLDGMAAKRFGSLSGANGLDADGIADTALAFGSTLVPVIYYWHTPGLGVSLGVLYALTAVSGSVMAFWAMSRANHDILARKVIAVNMIVFHGGIQIVVAMLWFADMAGTAWFAITVIGLGAVISSQISKIVGWLEGRLTPYGQ